ncbi:MAG: ATP-dependent DNA helicase RecG [Bacteroidia bacterium]|jgi:ATP-dependent DNA helicase RecG
MATYNTNHIIEILTKVRSEPSEKYESESVEFKEYRDEVALHNSKELAEEISAIANKDGGVLIIGVKDSSNVKNQNWASQLVGFPKIDLLLTKERILGKIKPPSFSISIEELEFEFKNFCVIYIPKKRNSLIATSSGKICIRDGRSSRPMDPSEVEKAVKSLQPYDWSSESIDNLNVNDSLDTKSLQEAYDYYINNRDDSANLATANFLEAIEVTRNGVITNGGLLFLGKKEIIREQLGIFEYRFSWKTTSGELLINEVWSDNIWNSIQKAKLMFNKCNSTIPIDFQGKTHQIHLLDETAFHEAFLNSIVHRDYSGDGMISVNYNRDNIKISNPGDFYGGITSDNIAIHEPRHRNKSLARILMLFHMVDRAGMGIQRMALRSLRYGRRFPEFKETFGNIEVSMEAEYFIPSVFVIIEGAADQFGIVEMFILNSLYEDGSIEVGILQKRINRVVENPWENIQKSLKKSELSNKIELIGTKNGVYLSVTKGWKKYFDVAQSIRKSTASSKYVLLYRHLKKYDKDSNANISELLGHSHSSQTSAFLREAKFVKRTGTGKNALWSIID